MQPWGECRVGVYGFRISLRHNFGKNDCKVLDTESLILQGVEPYMMLFSKGHRFYDKYDNYICKTARDLYMLEPVSVEDFTDWQIPVPASGDIIHPVIMMEANEKIKYLLPVQEKVKYSFVKMIYKLLGGG